MPRCAYLVLFLAACMCLQSLQTHRMVDGFLTTATRGVFRKSLYSDRYTNTSPYYTTESTVINMIR